MNRYFAYCRKSTEEEDRQVLSIESQLQELKRYAERERLKIVATFEESRTARKPGRPIFGDLMKRVEHGEANGILSWNPDRLARNGLDGGWILHLLDTGKLSDLRFPTYTFENTPQGKFMLAIMFGQSKYYVDALSENVRRGNRTKREKGWLPGRAPLGYVNAVSPSGEKVIAIDPERFHIVKKLWELLLSGGYSIAELLRIASERFGLRMPKKKRIGGKPPGVSSFYRLFSNPFYAGHIVFRGEWYQAKHEPMITLGQYDRAQALLGSRGRPRPKVHRFAYTGLIRCGYCGCGVTAEEKVNRFGSRYTYYHCTHKKRDTGCTEGSVEVEDLESQILMFLDKVSIDNGRLTEILSLVEQTRWDEQRADEAVLASLHSAIEAADRSLDNLAGMRFRDLINDEEFVRQKSKLTQEKLRLEETLSSMSRPIRLEPLRRFFLFANRAKFWLIHGNLDEKRLILSAIGSNFRLAGKRLSIEAKKPFRILENRASFSNLSTVMHDVRTFFEENPMFDIPELPEPNALEKAA